MTDDEEMTTFERVLDATFREYTPSQYLQSTGDNHVLDIGCSSCQEAPLVKKHFGERTKITGIDLKGTSIRVARHNYPDDTFVCGNALEILPKLPKDFDIVLMLHPEIRHNYEFGRILEMSADNMKEGGTLVSSLYSASEFRTMKSLVEGSSQYETLVAERNKAQPEEGFMTYFQYLVIARRV